jgi:hypothetical protein
MLSSACSLRCVRDASPVRNRAPRVLRYGTLAAAHPPGRPHIRIEPGTQLGGVRLVEIDLEGDPSRTDDPVSTAAEPSRSSTSCSITFRAMPAD